MEKITRKKLYQADIDHRVKDFIAKVKREKPIAFLSTWINPDGTFGSTGAGSHLHIEVMMTELLIILKKS